MIANSATAMATSPTYRIHAAEIPYEPPRRLSSLERFNLARCSRERMLLYVTDGPRWEREHSSLFSHVAAIAAHEANPD